MAKKRRGNKGRGGSPSGKRTDGKRTDENRTPENRTPENRTDGKRTDGKRTDGKRTDGKRTDAKRTDGMRTDAKRTGGGKTRVRIADTRAIPEPRFWYGFEVTWAKVWLVRVVVFGLLALDAILQIRHAPRYGAGGFNVAHLPGLDALGPGRVAYEVCQLIEAYLFVLVACGVVVRYALPIAAALYAWLYFGSQLDSYQHHYLVAMILLVACFVPWERPASGEPRTPVYSWALRLILVELGIMYFWAAISKMNHAWTSGDTMSLQIQDTMRRVIEGSIGFKRAARFVIGIELLLALSVWNRRSWPLAAPLGIVFHASILLGDLDIGLFAWLMLGLYLLVVPDRVWVFVAELPPVAMLRRGLAKLGERVRALPWPVLPAAIVVGVVLAAFARFDHALVAGIVVALAGGLAALPRVRRTVSFGALAAAQVTALFAWLVIDRSTSVAYDYYKFFGGSARRFGTPAEIEHAYRGLVKIAPDEEAGHYHLGVALLQRGASDEGLAELHEAERVAPRVARALVAEATWLAQHGRASEALDKARAAQRLEPDNREVLDLLNSLSTRRGAAPQK